MAKFEKLKQRLISKPTDFTYDELKTLLSGFGYEEVTKEKTSGSRVAFIQQETKHVINLHKPHPSNIIKRYALQYILDTFKTRTIIMTPNIITYKEFIGSVNYSDTDECFFGKIEGINDLVSFEASSVKELKKAFHEAVNDYLATCKLAGNEPYRSVKGSFNVRIEPRLHYSAIYTALKNGMSLNQFVAEAIKKNLDEKMLNHS